MNRAEANQAPPWWFGLIHQGMLLPWTLLATCSANRAAITQSFVRHQGTGGDGPIDLRDSKAVRKWLNHSVSQYPGSLVDHWALIQRELFRDLQEGKNVFARNLAEKRKQCLDNLSATKGSLTKDAFTKETLKIEDVSRFKEALKQTFSENPGGYANEIDRFIVQRWTVRPEPDLPPFCCWKDEPISDYLAEKAGKAKGWGAKFVEDRRSALGLLKIPAFIVVEWKQGSQGNRGMPGFDLGLRDNPKLDLDALRWICVRLDFEIFCDAFPQDEEFLQRAKQFLQLPISDTLRSDIEKRVQLIRTDSEDTTS